MINKQTIKLRKYDNDEILKVAPSSCAYIDDEFFKEDMGEDLEDPSCNTHSTTIKAIRVDWMLNEDEGLKFLRQTLQQKNRDIFMTIYIKVLVHFLYQKYKAKIMNFLLPPYLLHLSAVMMQIHASERYRDELANNEYGQADFSFIDLVEQG